VEIPKEQFAPSPHLGPLSSLSLPYVVLKLPTSFKSFIRKARWSTRRDQSLQLCIPCEILTSFSEPRRCTYSLLRRKRDVWRRLGADVYYHFLQIMSRRRWDRGLWLFDLLYLDIGVEGKAFSSGEAMSNLRCTSRKGAR
jgi:hypothetical protein